MGIEAFIFQVNKDYVIDHFTIKEPNYKEDVIIYWKNNYKIHGWMTQLYYNKGGRCFFNGKIVRITLADLQKFEKDIRTIYPDDVSEENNNDGDTECSSLDSESSDYNFIDKIRKSINNGYAVYYYFIW